MRAADAFRARWRARTRRAMISVHRGLWQPAPENSLAAISGARGYDIVEIDARLSADGIPVLMHDESLERMTGLQADVGALSVGRIVALPLLTGAGGAGAEVTDQRVPTLADALEALDDKAFFDVDVKDAAELAPIAAAIAALGAQDRCSIKIDTFGPADIATLRALEDRHGVMVMAKVILPKADPGHIRALAEAGVAVAEVWFDDLAQLRAAAEAAGDRLALATFTLDPVHCCGLSDARALADPGAVWGTLLDAGVTILMTDRAAEFAAYLDTRPRR